VLVTCLAAGALSDKIGRKPLMLIHCIAFLLLTYPLMRVLARGAGFTTVIMVQALLAVLTGLFLGSFPTALVEFFPTRRRLAGLGTALPQNRVDLPSPFSCLPKRGSMRGRV
jgi:MHS family proline/betaine transporter-like MFS transporter